MKLQLVFGSILILVASSSFAQEEKLDEVTGRAGDKAEGRVDQKIDRGIDTGLDKLEGVFFGGKKKKGNKASKDDPKTETDDTPTMPTTIDGSTSTKVEITENQDPYEPLGFTGSFRMEMHSYKNGKEEKDSPAFVRMAFSDDLMAMLPEAPDNKGDVRMVYDLKNKYTYTLITDEKGARSGIKMKMMKVKFDDGSLGDDQVSKVTRTEQTRSIESHMCRRYTYSDDDGHGEAWVAEDVDLNLMKAFAQMAGDQKGARMQHAPFKGMLMESTWNDKNGKDKVTMFTRDLIVGSVDQSVFSTNGYVVQDMTSLPVFGQ